LVVYQLVLLKHHLVFFSKKFEQKKLVYVELVPLSMEIDMNIAERRRENLRHYIDEKFSTRKEFAKQIGKSYSQVTTWFLTSKSKRDIGEKLARELEVLLELPSGWLDKEHNLIELEFVEALNSLGYEVSENKELFDYNELQYRPQFRVHKGEDTFLVSTMNSPLGNNNHIRIASGLNLSHFLTNLENSIVLLCEDDLYFFKYGGLQDVIDKRLDLARAGSPYDESDFLIPIGVQIEAPKSSGLWSQLKLHLSKAAKEKQHTDAVVAAKQLLTINGINVFEAPMSKSGRLMVMNKVLWSMPSLIIYLPGESKSFYIDIYPEKRLGIIPVMPDNKCQEILFVKQTEVIDIVPLVRKHIVKWFT
jgi:hypothetical protein